MVYSDFAPRKTGHKTATVPLLPFCFRLREMRLCRRYRKGMRISAFAPISLFRSISSIRFTSIGILWVVLEVDRLVSGKVALPMAAT